MEDEPIATLQPVDAGPGRVLYVGRTDAAVRVPFDCMVVLEQIEGTERYALRLVIGDRQAGPGKRAARR